MVSYKHRCQKAKMLKLFDGREMGKLHHVASVTKVAHVPCPLLQREDGIAP